MGLSHLQICLTQGIQALLLGLFRLIIILWLLLRLPLLLCRRLLLLLLQLLPPRLCLLLNTRLLLRGQWLHTWPGVWLWLCLAP